jgi:hypothetical protein
MAGSIVMIPLAVLALGVVQPVPALPGSGSYIIES